MTSLSKKDVCVCDWPENECKNAIERKSLALRREKKNQNKNQKLHVSKTYFRICAAAISRISILALEARPLVRQVYRFTLLAKRCWLSNDI